MRELRSRLGFANLPSMPVDTLEKCLFPFERARLQEWREWFMEKQMDTSMPCLTDLVQNVGWSAAGATFPTFTRNMILVDLQKPVSRLITSSEMFLSQGHPVGMCINGLPFEQGSLAWQDHYNHLNRRDRLALLGNGQHIVSTGRFIMWALSNLIHIDDLDYQYKVLGEHRLASCSELWEVSDDSDNE